MHDCRRGLRAVPISKKEDEMRKEAPRTLLIVGIAAVILTSFVVWRTK
jgi:hypothetical protein